MKILTTISISLLFFLSRPVSSQVTFQATVANQTVNGTSISFDVYLTRTGANDLFLGNADFVFFFNNSNFTTPTIEYVDESNSLLNSNGTPTTSYNENIVTDQSFLLSGQLVINVQQPTFSNQTQFNSRIAKIDNTPNTHKLGTFIVTGISNPAGTFDLEWKTELPGVFTNVQTLTNTDPWISSAATGEYQNPSNVTLPVEFESFVASIDRRDVHLNWTTASEINNSGFDVERSNLNSQNEWLKIGFLNGYGTTNESQIYSFTDRGLITGSYNYRLKQVDYNGNFEYFNLSNEVIIGVPEKYELSQNYPNPFNPTTRINFDLPFDSKVTMKIIDITGREVKSILNEQKAAGFYTIEFNAAGLSSGTYFYRLQADEFNSVKKMVILK